MPSLKRTARRLAALALYYSGLLWIYAEFRLKHKAVVLMYHRILPADVESFSHEGIIVPPNIFDMHMKFLRRHFAPLTPEQFCQQLRDADFVRRACLVTFDDGWSDNHRHALPVLVKNRIPALVFVTTAYVGTDRTFWQERLTRLLFVASRSGAFGGEILRELGCPDVTGLPDPDAKRRLRDVVTSLKRRNAAEIDSILERLAEASASRGMSSAGVGLDRFMSWAEALELQRTNLVTIGSHAHTHRPLTNLTYHDVLEEFTRSRDAIRTHGIRQADMCAYPNGNVDSGVVRAAKACGFTLGFATGKRRVSTSDDPLQVPRINIHGSSSGSKAEFLCRILGIL